MDPGKTEQEQYDLLAYYTLDHPDPSFIHQHIVDAFAAQTADENTKPIRTTFALIGLYLFLEKGFSGKEVQSAHVQLAKKRKQWPEFDLPQQRGGINVSDVLETPPGAERDEMIRKWCASVWEAYGASHKEVADLVQKELWGE
jgi:Family of unknown function (DUF5946)